MTFFRIFKEMKIGYFIIKYYLNVFNIIDTKKDVAKNGISLKIKCLIKRIMNWLVVSNPLT